MTSVSTDKNKSRPPLRKGSRDLLLSKGKSEELLCAFLHWPSPTVYISWAAWLMGAAWRPKSTRSRTKLEAWVIALHGVAPTGWAPTVGAQPVGATPGSAITHAGHEDALSKTKS